MIKFEAGDVAGAKTWFEKAYTIDKSKESSLNLALCAISEGADNATVEAYLNQAAGAENYEGALGLLYIKKGDYANAVKAFGDQKSNNAALAQILAKDYSKAKATLAGVEKPDAETYYLQAIVGARTNNKAEIVDGLKKSIAQDPAMAKKAANDIEFAKYLVDAEVASLLS
jgi:tetratricopeptide (TPR) repeat protein